MNTSTAPTGPRLREYLTRRPRPARLLAVVAALTAAITGLVAIPAGAAEQPPPGVTTLPTLQAKPPAAVTSGIDSRQYLFALGDDNRLWATEQAAGDSTRWSDWYLIGTRQFSQPPTAVTNAQGFVEVYSVGTDSAVYRFVQNGAGWAEGQVNVCCIASKISVAKDRFDRLNVFGLGTDNNVYLTRQTEAGANTFTPWQSLGGWLASAPAAASQPGGKIFVFAPGGDAQLYSNTITDIDASNRQISGWTARGGGSIVGDVSAAFAGTGVSGVGSGFISIFARRTDNNVYGTHITLPSERWDLSPWQAVGQGTVTSDPVTSAGGGGSYQHAPVVFALGTDRRVYASRTICIADGSVFPCPSTQYSGWYSIGTWELVAPPAVTRFFDSRTQVFGIGLDRRAALNTQLTRGRDQFSGWSYKPGDGIAPQCTYVWPTDTVFYVPFSYRGCNDERFTYDGSNGLVLLGPGGNVVFSTGTTTSPQVEFQSNGNLVLRRFDLVGDASIIWQSGTSAPGGRLEFGPGGSLIIYDSAGQPVWQRP